MGQQRSGTSAVDVLSTAVMLLLLLLLLMMMMMVYVML